MFRSLKPMGEDSRLPGGDSRKYLGRGVEINIPAGIPLPSLFIFPFCLTSSGDYLCNHVLLYRSKTALLTMTF